MSTIFSKIIAREIPGHFVYEDADCVVLMDKFPAVAGQTLVVPKQETDYLFDLDEKLYQHLFSVAKRVARASDIAFKTERTCLVVEGFEVPHVHLRLYPMTSSARGLGKVMVEQSEAADAVLAEQAETLAAILESTEK
jgi:diadenosine tetraphosphate (Ap4A) HIT family hydrolase